MQRGKGAVQYSAVQYSRLKLDDVVSAAVKYSSKQYGIVKLAGVVLVIGWADLDYFHNLSLRLNIGSFRFYKSFATLGLIEHSPALLER